MTNKWQNKDTTQGFLPTWFTCLTVMQCDVPHPKLYNFLLYFISFFTQPVARTNVCFRVLEIPVLRFTNIERLLKSLYFPTCCFTRTPDLPTTAQKYAYFGTRDAV